MNKISPNLQVIIVTDHTLQSNNRTVRIPRYGCPNHHLSTSVLHCGKKAVRVVSFPGHKLALQLKKEKTGLVGEYHLLPLVYRPAPLISTPLQPLLNVDGGKQRFPNGGFSMIFGLIELSANIFG